MKLLYLWEHYVKRLSENFFSVLWFSEEDSIVWENATLQSSLLS